MITRASSGQASAILAGTQLPENPPLRAYLSKFETWERTGPTLPARSSLYALAPCGIGTPYVESLSSYIARLAEAHVVSVWRLILYVLSPVRHGRVSRATKGYTYPANGLGKGSQVLLESFKAATCRPDLHLLTLCSLQGSIAQPMIFRSVEAWCPACLEEWRAADRPIYSPLLWALRLVTVCPVHLCPLVERCPRCRSAFVPLSAWGRPGYCPACFEWRGSSAAQSPAQGLRKTERYAHWVAISIGQMLATIPTLQPSLLPTALQKNLLGCLAQTEGATRRSLSALAGSFSDAFGTWLSGRVKPPLDQLCRLCYQLKLAPVSLFCGIPADWRGPRLSPQEVHITLTRCGRKAQGTRNELRRTLAAALKESPPPSVAELARRLKYRCTETLRCQEPDLCKAIAERRRKARPCGYRCKQIYTKSARAKLPSALRPYLAQNNPPSLNRIASHLGYKSSTSIRDRCPAICKQIMQKRRESFHRQREQMRRALEYARTENPPPPLKQIARCLGFTAEGVLVQAYPEICHAYMSYRRSCLEQKRNSLRVAIRQWLATEPAPTRTSLCRHFRIPLSTFEVNFPEENQEVVRRSSEQAQKARDNRHLTMRKEVLAIVRDLKSKNLYPSLPRVRSALSPGTVRYGPQLRAAVDEALSQLV